MIAVPACASSASQEAREFADRACSDSQIDLSDLLVRDVDELDESALQALANQADMRAEAGRKAAELDPRWAILSEASMLISQFADDMVAMSQRGMPPSQALDAGAWDRYKAASNAYGFECRNVVRGDTA
jgi:hypothetical protein